MTRVASRRAAQAPRRFLMTLGAFAAALLLAAPTGAAWYRESHEDIMDLALEIDDPSDLPALRQLSIGRHEGSVKVDDNTCLDDPVLRLSGGTPDQILSWNVGKTDDVDPDGESGVIGARGLTLSEIHWKWQGWKWHNPICVVGFFETEDFRQKFLALGGIWGNAPLRAQDFYDRAMSSFSAGNAAEGLFYLALGAHYVQEMSDPWQSGFGADIEVVRIGIMAGCVALAAGLATATFGIGAAAIAACVWLVNDGPEGALEKVVSTLTLSDVHTAIQNYAVDEYPPNVDASTLKARTLAGGASYPAFLALETQAKFLGPQATAAYILKLVKGDKKALNSVLDTLYKNGAEYSAGYVADALRRLPRLEPRNLRVVHDADKTTITFQITNHGQSDAESVDWRVYDEAPCPNNNFFVFMRCMFSSVQAAGSQDVPAGKTVDVKREIRPPLDPSRSYRLTIDPPLDGSCQFAGRAGCHLEVKEALPPPSEAPPEPEPAPEEEKVIYVPLPDLAIGPEDVRTIPGQAGVSYTVHNVGQGNAGAFDVDVYARNPQNGQLSARCHATIQSLPAGGAFAGVCPESVPLPVVRIDEDGLVVEDVEAANNQASNDVLVVDQDTYIQNQLVEPASDVIVLPNVALTYDGVTLRMREGARLTVLPGGQLTLVRTTAEPAAGATGYLLQSQGTLNILDSNVRGTHNGVEASGPRSSILRSTLESRAAGYAVVASAGTLDLESSTITGPGGGLLVLPKAEAHLLNNRFDRNDRIAIELNGGLTTLSGDTILGSPVGLRAAVSAAAILDHVLFEPRTGIRVNGPTVGIEARGGLVDGENVTLRLADKAIAGNDGRITLEKGTIATDTLSNIDGSLAVTLRNLTAVQRTSLVGGSASIRLEWPLMANIVGPAPDFQPLSGALLDLADAQGTTVLHGLAGSEATLSLILPEFVQTASGLVNKAPYRLSATYNSAPGVMNIDLHSPLTVSLPTPVLPDLAAAFVEPVYTGGQHQLMARVVNLEPARAADTTADFYVNGALIGTRPLGVIGPGRVANATLVWVPPDGVANIQVRVNSAALIQESRSDNNVAEAQAWVVDDRQTCANGSVSLTGYVLVVPAGQLILNNCQLLLGGTSDQASAVTVLPGGRIEATGGARLVSANPTIPFGVQALGDVVVADAFVTNVKPFLILGNATIQRTTFSTDSGPSLISIQGEVVVEDSHFGGGRNASGIHIGGGGATLRRNTYSDLGATGIEIDDTNRATVIGERLHNVTRGILLFNGTYQVEDTEAIDRVNESFELLGADATLLNVTHDLTSLRLDPGTNLKVSWHTKAEVKGSDGEAVPNTAVTVIDRFGQWLGQFNTDAAGRTTDLRLAQFTARDENWNGLVDEAEKWAQGPYTLRAGAVQVVRDVLTNGALPVPQDYQPKATTNFPFLQFSPGQELTYPLTVKNLGNGRDTMAFGLANVPNGWTAQLSSAGATLTPGATTPLSVTLRAPAQENKVARFNVTVTSEDGAKVARLELSAKTGPNVLPQALAVVRPLAVYRGDVVTAEDHSKDPDGFIAGASWDFGDGTQAQGLVAQHQYSTLGSFTVRLTTHDNANATAVHTQVVQVLNRPPSLQDATVSPASGTTSDSYAFAVTYRDPDGDLPATIRVRLDGFLHDLAAVDAVPNPLVGARYAITLGGLQRGTHLARFVASDAAGGSIQYPPNADLASPVVNDPPILTPSLDPSSGEPDTLFTYRVQYRDLEGDAPAFVNLFVDNRPPLALVRETPFASDFVAGVTYMGRLTLDTAGAHSYRFEASDGKRTTTTSLLSGPTVQVAPALGQPSVSPEQAGPGAPFLFRVLYRDAQGQVPQAVRAVVDQQVLTMTPVDANPDVVAGAVYQVQKNLSTAGRHPFWFEATLPSSTLRLPEAGSFDGPIVNLAPTAGFQIAPSVGTIQTDFVLNATASSDPDAPQAPLEVQAEWGDGSVSPWVRPFSLVHRYVTPGNYAVRLVARDTWGALSAPVVQTVRVDDHLPTASFDVLPSSGVAEEGDGIGTQFAFRPGGVGDLEDSPDRLKIRWDFDGDGTWDTAWLQGLALSYHFYSLAGEYNAALEVMDTANHVVGSTRTVLVDGTHALTLNEIVDRPMKVEGERHYYKLEVPPNLVNIFATMTEAADAGVDYSIYIQRATKPDPLNCASANCVAGGPADKACWRVPAAGTYYVLVVADLLQVGQTSYGLQVRPNHTALSEASTLARCATSGPAPSPT